MSRKRDKGRARRAKTTVRGVCHHGFPLPPGGSPQWQMQIDFMKTLKTNALQQRDANALAMVVGTLEKHHEVLDDSKNRKMIITPCSFRSRVDFEAWG